MTFARAAQDRVRAADATVMNKWMAMGAIHGAVENALPRWQKCNGRRCGTHALPLLASE